MDDFKTSLMAAMVALSPAIAIGIVIGGVCLMDALGMVTH